MKTRIVSMSHPSIRPEKLYGRKAVASDGRVGVLERDPMGGYLPVVGFEDKTWLPTGTLVRLVVEG